MARKKRKAPDPPQDTTNARQTTREGLPVLAGELPVTPTGRTLAEPLWGADGRLMHPLSLANLRPARPGSNNGVHRGPDKFPRKDVMRALALGVLGNTGPRPLRDPITGRLVRRLGGDIAVFPAAFLGLVLFQERLLRVLHRGKDEHVIRLFGEFHRAFQDSKGETPEAPPPRRATFVLEPPLVPPPAPAPQDDDGPAMFYNGEPYVSG